MAYSLLLSSMLNKLLGIIFTSVNSLLLSSMLNKWHGITFKITTDIMHSPDGELLKAMCDNEIRSESHTLLANRSTGYHNKVALSFGLKS